MRRTARALFGSLCQKGRCSQLAGFAAGVAFVQTATCDSGKSAFFSSAEESSKATAKHKLPPFDERVEGNYRNRIRMHSTPEKIFETFASIELGGGEKLMTWTDFKNALLPYDFREGSGRRKTVPPKFLLDLVHKIESADPKSNADDDAIAFAPFLFVNNLLSLPPEDFELAFKMFDTNDNGTMDGKEFMNLMDHFRADSFSAYDYSFVEPLFKEVFPEEEIPFAKFKRFLADLRESVLQLEFKNYARSLSKQMTARDFCVSLIAWAEHRQIPWYIARINRIPDGEFSAVTWTQFRDFNMALAYLPQIVEALKLYSKCREEVSAEVFKRTVQVVTGTTLSDNLVALIFWLFDKDADGRLDYDEIDVVLGRRYAQGSCTDRVFGFTRFVACVKKCVTS